MKIENTASRFFKNFCIASLINSIFYFVFLKAFIYISNPLTFIISINLMTAFFITVLFSNSKSQEIEDTLV